MGQNRSSAIAVCKIDGDMYGDMYNVSVTGLLFLSVCLSFFLFCLSVLLNVLGFIFDETQCAANVVLY